MKPQRPSSDSFRDALTALLAWVAERDPAAAAGALAEWDGEVAHERVGGQRHGASSSAPGATPRGSHPLQSCPSC